MLSFDKLHRFRDIRMLVIHIKPFTTISIVNQIFKNNVENDEIYRVYCE